MDAATLSTDPAGGWTVAPGCSCASTLPCSGLADPTPRAGPSPGHDPPTSKCSRPPRAPGMLSRCAQHTRGRSADFRQGSILGAHCSAAFPGRQQGASWEVEQLGLEPAFRWEAGITSSGFACHATVLATSLMPSQVTLAFSPRKDSQENLPCPVPTPYQNKAKQNWGRIFPVSHLEWQGRRMNREELGTCPNKNQSG